MGRICKRCGKSFDDSLPIRSVECYEEDAYYACPHCGKLYRYYMVIESDEPTFYGNDKDEWGNKIVSDLEYIENEFNIKLEDGEFYYVETDRGEYRWIAIYDSKKGKYALSYHASMDYDEDIIEFDNFLCNYDSVSCIRPASDEEISSFMKVLKEVYYKDWNKNNKVFIDYEKM